MPESAVKAGSGITFLLLLLYFNNIHDGCLKGIYADVYLL